MRAAIDGETPRDTLVTFLPHRLNRQPVVVRGLTADELWICAGLSGPPPGWRSACRWPGSRTASLSAARTAP